MADSLALPYNQRQVVTIDIPPSTIDDLPDDVLLMIFGFYVVRKRCGYLIESTDRLQNRRMGQKSWELLVHVCRRWRGLVFGSPRHLNLQLFCTTSTPAREASDIWPPLPLVIQGDVSETSVDNVVAELELSDRICQIELSLDTNFQIEKLWAAMQVPFPELAALYLSFSSGVSFVPVFPDSFFGGSAPRLKHLALNSFPSSGLPKLLLPATHIVDLYLRNIPFSGYISPEEMATCISMLTRLERLDIHFWSPQSCPDQENRRSPPPTRSVLPTLTLFWFKGVHEYLEDLLAWIDTPRLRLLSATFFNDIDFDTPELIRFVSRSSIFKTPYEAHVSFDNQTASVTLQSLASNVECFYVNILCREPDWQLSSLVQICTASLPLLSATENLFICKRYNSQLDWKEGIENIEWLELLLLFTAVKNLYISKQFLPRIAPALQDMTGGGATEVLSSLQNLYLEGFQSSESVKEGIEGFISARQLTNPVAISAWARV